MTRNRLLFFIFLLAITVMLMGCMLSGEKNPGKELVMGQLDYETVQIPSEEFDKLSKDDFAAWYEENYHVEGLHTFTDDENLYLLLSAGEKPTGGYYLEDVILLGTETEIEVTAKLHVPGKDEMVTEALTYPHLIVYVPDDGRKPVFDGFEINNPVDEVAVQEDSGSYVGQIDGNSIEIKISGVPDEISARAFRLGDEIRENFEERFGLKTGDEVKFTYIPKENEQPVIIELKKM